MTRIQMFGMDLSECLSCVSVCFQKVHHSPLDTALSFGLVPVFLSQTSCGSDPSPGKSSTQKTHLRFCKPLLRQTMINQTYTWNPKSKVAPHPVGDNDPLIKPGQLFPLEDKSSGDNTFR